MRVTEHYACAEFTRQRMCKIQQSLHAALGSEDLLFGDACFSYCFNEGIAALGHRAGFMENRPSFSGVIFRG